MPIFLYKSIRQFIEPMNSTSGRCFEYPCYAAPINVSLTDKCTLCTQGENYCPWDLNIVMTCHAAPSKEFPRLCGVKNCHIYDDCRIGGGADGKYLGFPINSDFCNDYYEQLMTFSAGFRFLHAVVMSWLADSLSQGKISKQDMEFYPFVISWISYSLVIWFGSRIMIMDIVFDVSPWGQQMVSLMGFPTNIE